MQGADDVPTEASARVSRGPRPCPRVAASAHAAGSQTHLLDFLKEVIATPCASES